MVADPPEDHLCRHALVDLVQQLFDEPSACFSRHKLERAAAVKLPFGSAKPTPCAFAVSEDLFSQRAIRARRTARSDSSRLNASLRARRWVSVRLGTTSE
jgi:hypothetical protein